MRCPIVIALSRTARIDVRAKDTAEDRGLNVCEENRDAVFSVLEEAGKLMQDEDIAKSTVFERLDADVC